MYLFLLLQELHEKNICNVFEYIIIIGFSMKNSNHDNLEFCTFKYTNASKEMA